MSKTVLSVENLTKHYSDNKEKKFVKALNDVNFEVNQGDVFGLLGPNGAGKTTFLNILAGTVIKTKGKVIVWGFDLDKNPRQVKASIGIVPQEINLDPFFSPRQLLELQSGLYGVTKNQRITDIILKIVSLEKQANSYSRNLSGGMKRRLLIAKALVHQPPIVVLDEPTAGVDVELRENLWSNVRELNKAGVTIILTTHYLLEAQKMCNRIAIIDKGNLVALDTTKKLLEKIQFKKIEFKIKNLQDNSNIKLKDVEFKILSDYIIIAKYEKKLNKFPEIIKYFNDIGLQVMDIATDDGDLEDVFLQLTKN